MALGLQSKPQYQADFLNYAMNPRGTTMGHGRPHESVGLSYFDGTIITSRV